MWRKGEGLSGGGVWEWKVVGYQECLTFWTRLYEVLYRKICKKSERIFRKSGKHALQKSKENFFHGGCACTGDEPFKNIMRNGIPNIVVKNSNRNTRKWLFEYVMFS